MAFQIYSKVVRNKVIIALNEIAIYEEKAFELYLKLAKGYLVAQFNVGACYIDGTGMSTRSTNVEILMYFELLDIAIPWAKVLVKMKKGYSKSLYNLGSSYENGSGKNKDQVKALERIKDLWKIIILIANTSLGNSFVKDVEKTII
ncbi:hypothetical protein Glove_236g54 [Diversispora epigaea]|uniref:Uncharacterized protein n=1 Tax=Diversispora epigaea TaxID=1348612 RepID=A0A397IB76_9GLOM|nr:hypothetical protein Glove_236g54 [Diversispora epigaea]